MVSDFFMEVIFSSYAKRLTPLAAANYKGIIHGFCNYIGKSFEFCSVTDAQSYDHHLAVLENSTDKKRISRSTHIARISVLRCISAYIEEACILGNDYTNIFKDIFVVNETNELQDDDIPLIEDLEVLFRAAADDIPALLIFSLAAKCGLSTSQICDISVSDIVLNNDGSVDALVIKNEGSPYTISIPDDLSAIFDKYIASLNRQSTALFLNKHGNPLKIRTLQRILQEYVDSLQNEMYSTKLTFQQMRHAAIIYMKMGGASDAEIADFIGVHQPLHLLRYDSVSSKNKKRAVNYSVLSVNV